MCNNSQFRELGPIREQFSLCGTTWHKTPSKKHELQQTAQELIAGTLLRCRGDATRILDPARANLIYADVAGLYSALDTLINRTPALRKADCYLVRVIDPNAEGYPITGSDHREQGGDSPGGGGTQTAPTGKYDEALATVSGGSAGSPKGGLGGRNYRGGRGVWVLGLKFSKKSSEARDSVVGGNIWISWRSGEGNEVVPAIEKLCCRMGGMDFVKRWVDSDGGPVVWDICRMRIVGLYPSIGTNSSP